MFVKPPIASNGEFKFRGVRGMSKKGLMRWVKYNHNILNGILPGNEEVNNYRKLISDLSDSDITAPNIIGFDEDCYIVEYLEGKKKKSIKVLISEIEIIRMQEIPNPYS
jgi:hypothetical protein